MSTTTTGRRAATSSTVARPVAAPADYLAQAKGEVEREVRQLEQALRRTDREAMRLQAQVYGLEDKGRQAEADKLWPRYLRTVNAGTATSQRLSELRGAGLERRAAELARKADERARLDELKADKAAEAAQLALEDADA